MIPRTIYQGLIAMKKITLNNPSIMTVSLAMSVFGLLVTWGVELLIKELFHLSYKQTRKRLTYKTVSKSSSFFC